MPTSSFDKAFVVRSPKASEKLLLDLENPVPVAIKHTDLDAESKKGIALIKKNLTRK